MLLFFTRDRENYIKFGSSSFDLDRILLFDKVNKFIEIPLLLYPFYTEIHLRFLFKVFNLIKFLSFLIYKSESSSKSIISSDMQVLFSKACGKVLIAGGYGVLQKNNIGLTLALQNYFFCKLQHSSKGQKTKVTVISPQIHKKYEYQFCQQSSCLKQKTNQENVFVSSALHFGLVNFDALRNVGNLKITLIFDKGFISAKSIQKYDENFPIYADNYAKTGLGSSACVIVTIVSAICELMGQKQNKRLINVISQLANLSAQKKIGSNFDISTAIYGTHLYRNVLPQLLYNFIQEKKFSQLKQIDPQITQLNHVNHVLQNEAVAFMIDVSKGANTRVMVSNFLKNLKKQSENLQNQFYEQSKTISGELCKIFQSNQAQDVKSSLKKVNVRHRNLQQKFSKITHTEIQPQPLTHFLDAIMSNDNVFYVICPGSGGFDALFMLGSKKKNKQYYEQLIEQTRINNQKQLGSQVNFHLNQINIKWNPVMSVNNNQIQKIQTFLSDNSL